MTNDYTYTPEEVADHWEVWLGVTKWTEYMRALQPFNVSIIWYGGYPRSASAIPLCFVIQDINGNKLNEGSRLKDIKQTLLNLKSERS